MVDDDYALTCDGCDVPLSGRQRRWCNDPVTQCRKTAAREKHIRQCFDISLEEYDLVLTFQGGGCGICGKPPKSGKSLAVDHDHVSGVVRGLLCFFCNKRVLGARTVEVLVATAAYVTNPPAVRALGREVIAPGRPKKVPKKRQPRKRARNGGPR